MNSARRKQIEDLCFAAMKREGEERAAFLEEECKGDEALLREVVSLLEHEQAAEEFLETPALEAEAEALAQDQASSMVGRQIGSYKIVSPIGAGGMGEVYLAQDATLGRKVALKFLPEEMQQNELARKRFLREARSAAALDHPYICKIYEIGEAEKAPYIAMEYVRGTTLDEGFSKKVPPPLEKVLRTALQIAEALGAAHRKGIVHRDLKPANIMLTSEGHVKVMDFGLAKRVATEDPEQELTAALTAEGTTVGTVPYMSPEQLSGKPVDTRTDIFSFGILLFEMLTGVHPFKKARPMATANAILNEVPVPLSQHRNDVPPILQHTVTKMLAKDSGKRYQLVHEVHTDLVGVIRGFGDPALLHTTSTRQQQPGQNSIALLWTVVLGVCALAVGAAAVWTFKPAPASDAVSFRWPIPLPVGERLGSEYRQGVALSPDGTQVAFVSGSKPESAKMPKTRIYLHHLDQWQPRAIPGTEDVTQPFFSPDGNWLGFVTRREELKKVNLSGAQPIQVCQCQASFGASWGSDDRIIFAGQAGGLFRVPASGGTPVRITELNEAAGEVSHRLPHILPNGKAVLFTALRYKTSGLDWNKAQIFVQSLETGERELLLKGGADARYVPTGHLVFAREARLLAVPFDLGRLEVTGPEFPVLEGVNRSIYTGNSSRETGVAQFSFSATGTLAYVAGSVYPERKLTPVWVDREGREEPLGVVPRLYNWGRVSPDGRHVLLTHAYPPRDVWLFDVERQTSRRQSFEGSHKASIWGPGKEFFTLSSDREGPVALYTKRVDSGLGDVEPLPGEIMGGFTSSWSPDGQKLALSVGGDILVLSREGEVEPFLETRFLEYWPAFSTDGKWIAYGSNDSGRFEVYFSSYPGPGSAVQVSTRGGMSPAWSRDGQEIFFRAPDLDPFYSVKVDADGERFPRSLPVKLFEGPYSDSEPVRSYDVTANGSFLLMKLPDKSALTALEEEFFPTRISLVQNWFQELKRLTPTGE